MYADPVFALIAQFSALAVIIVLCFFQAIREKRSFIGQLEKWQSSLAVIIGFSAVIWTMRFDIDKNMANAEADNVAHISKIMNAATLQGDQIWFESSSSRYWLGLAQNDIDKKDVKSCIQHLTEAQEENFKTFDFLSDNKDGLSYLPPEMSADVFGFFVTANKFQQRVATLNPNEECRAPFRSMRLVEAIVEGTSLGTIYKKMMDQLTGRNSQKKNALQ